MSNIYDNRDAAVTGNCTTNRSNTQVMVNTLVYSSSIDCRTHAIVVLTASVDTVRVCRERDLLMLFKPNLVITTISFSFFCSSSL